MTSVFEEVGRLLVRLSVYGENISGFGLASIAKCGYSAFLRRWHVCQFVCLFMETILQDLSSPQSQVVDVAHVPRNSTFVGSFVCS